MSYSQMQAQRFYAMALAARNSADRAAWTAESNRWQQRANRERPTT